MISYGNDYVNFSFIGMIYGEHFSVECDLYLLLYVYRKLVAGITSLFIKETRIFLLKRATLLNINLSYI